MASHADHQQYPHAADRAAPDRAAPDCTALRSAFAHFEPRWIAALPDRRNEVLAPVLVPLVRREGRLRALATRRSRGLRDHAGEVCFPGGHPEPADSDHAATALREAQEELGIGAVRIYGALSQMPVYTSEYRLVPFVGELAAGARLAPAEREVAEVLELDLLEVLAQPTIEAIPFEVQGPEGTLSGLSPIFVPRRLGGGVQRAVMFGATAHVLFELLWLLAPLYGARLPALSPSPFDWETVRETLR